MGNRTYTLRQRFQLIALQIQVSEAIECAEGRVKRMLRKPIVG